MIASSTTIPMASTKPNIVSVLIVNPSGKKKIKVPMIETGIARMGMSVERKLCKKTKTTIATSPSVINKVRTTSDIDTFTTVTASKGTEYSTSAGNDWRSNASSL